MFSRLTHTVACVSTPFLYTAESCSIVWIRHNLFTHSSTDGHLGYFYLSSIVSGAVMNLCVKVLVVSLFQSLRYISREKRKYQTVSTAAAPITGHQQYYA